MKQEKLKKLKNITLYLSSYYDAFSDKIDKFAILDTFAILET